MDTISREKDIPRKWCLNICTQRYQPRTTDNQTQITTAINWHFRAHRKKSILAIMHIVTEIEQDYMVFFSLV